MKPRILILSFSAIAGDPRVMRQVRLLEHRAALCVSGYGNKPDAAVEFLKITRPPATLGIKAWWSAKLLLGLFDSYYWNRPDIGAALEHLDGREFDLIIANDSATWPLALKLARGKPVLLDAHEYSPKEFDDRWLWRLLFARYQKYLCRTCLSQAASTITVSEGIAQEYLRNFNVLPKVVMNAPTLRALRPSPVVPGRVRLIHHGAAIRSRHLELMIDAMALLDQRFSLDLMLLESDAAYMRELKRRASRNPRVNFVPPARMEYICERINNYDVGVYLLAPVNFNQKYALPNKLFEFIQARLAIAIGPSHEMAAIVTKHGLGVVSRSFEAADLAKALAAMTEDDLRRYKQAADTVAPLLSYEKSSEVLLQEIGRLVSLPPVKAPNR